MATVFTLEGAFADEEGLPEDYLLQALGGEITNGNTIVEIDYPNATIFEAQVDTGAQMLNTAILSTSGPMVAFGHSLGAVVCANWLLNYGLTSTVSPELLTFVLIGNSVRPYGGLCYAIGYYPDSRTPSSTKYTITDLARQYDGWADIPANSVSIAGINQLYGANLVHPDYSGESLTAATNVGKVIGNITYMWSQTNPVPILGTSTTGQASNDKQLRPQIEEYYVRPVQIPTPNYSLY